MVVNGMPDKHTKLEALFNKVRTLSELQQELVAEVLAEMTASAYQLSNDELEILLPELAGANRGDYASQESVDAILNTPWVRSKSLAASGQ